MARALILVAWALAAAAAVPEFVEDAADKVIRDSLCNILTLL
jgi:hypothetical protein